MSHRRLATLVVLAAPALAPAVAAAQPDDAGAPLVIARLPGGPDAAAPGLGATVEGGWGGARAQATGAIAAEALLAGRVTIRAGLVEDAGTARPVAGVAYTFLDARRSPVGLLVGAAYKPEGLTEAEGEIEATVAVSRVVGAGLASASITYGQDADFVHHDGEVALSLIEPVSRRAAFGGVARTRNGLGSATDLGATWDGLAGGVARVQIGDYTISAVAGGELAKLATGAKLGVLGELALGAWW